MGDPQVLQVSAELEHLIIKQIEPKMLTELYVLFNMRAQPFPRVGCERVSGGFSQSAIQFCESL